MATGLQNAWVRRVLGAEIGAQDDEVVGGLDVETLTARLRVVREDAASIGAVAEVAGDLRAAVAALQKRDPTVVALVDALEQRIADIAGAARVREARQTIDAAATASGVGVVDFARMRLKVEAARAGFDDAIGNLKTSFETLFESDDFVDDPRSSDPATLAAIDALDRKVPPIARVADRIDVAIDRMSSTADVQQRRRHADEALEEIDAFKAELRKHPMLTEMENTDAGSFSIAGAMLGALDDVAAALRG